MDITVVQAGANLAAYQSDSEANKATVQPIAPVSTEVAQENADNADTGNSGEKQSAQSDSQNIEMAVAEVSEFVQSHAQTRQLAFSVDEQSQRAVVQVTDSATGDVIRQIPSEEVLKLSERIRELQTDVGDTVGILFNREV